MAKKNLSQCRRGREFIKYAKKQGASTEPAKGSHVKLRTENGVVIIPDHNGKDLGKGLRFAIIKQLAAIGITLFVGLVIAVQYAAGG